MKKRVAETFEGIQNEVTVEEYDRMMRDMRDMGITHRQVSGILGRGITGGNALEIGPGPGYLGLEWLKNAENGDLTVMDISSAMLTMVKKNAAEYGMSDRMKYAEGDAASLPFPDDSFDAVFSNGSLHEWAIPQLVFREIRRVLKPGGRFMVSDLRRNTSFFGKWLMKKSCNPREMLPGLISSLNASYTPAEIEVLVPSGMFIEVVIDRHFFGLSVSGKCPE